MKHLCLPAQSLEKPLLLITSLTVTLDVWTISLTCRKCKIQYVGQTGDQFCSRWNNYKSDSRKYSGGCSCMQQHLFNHFCTSGHIGFLDYISITFTDKIDPSDPLKREDYWHLLVSISKKVFYESLHFFYLFSLKLEVYGIYVSQDRLALRT